MPARHARKGIWYTKVAKNRVALAKGVVDCSHIRQWQGFMEWRQISTTRVVKKPVHGTRLQGKLGWCRLKSVIELG